jgi:hypothetical protein
MPSSELLRCTVCGQDFPTIDSLMEHQLAEEEEVELRHKGFADG